MMDIVFGDSACGSLKMAQHYGEGPYKTQVIGMAISNADGNEVAQEEIAAAKREWEQRERLAWKNAKPMGGNPDDVFGFSLGLSIGDISEDIPGEQRQRVLAWLFSIYPDDVGEEAARELFRSAKRTLDTIRGRAQAGESLRLWYSHLPDDMCGLYWFMAQIEDLLREGIQVSVVQLPEWGVDGNGNTVQYTGWGEVHPGDWSHFLAYEKPVPASFCRSCAAHWRELQKENAPLRAVLNDQLVSMPETLYDSFIEKEINAEDEVFQEAMVIGRVLGKYRLGVGDAWVAHRIEGLIRQGKLEPATEASKDSPIYHRKLRKCTTA
ncbi:DUF1835 domain-containing protein [Ruminococcaceae bacterium OttesenSCG-928-D13]|nr:DUF1835 domain-containing protein [Ruminococcaceae bacterium OttesenSCG-928-D13]